jgi:uncharacterized protein with HXXEE motif
MSFSALSWAFVLAIAMHNLEEAVWLPAWSQRSGRWHPTVGAAEFRFAVIVLTAAGAAVALAASIGGKGSLGAYLLSGYALAMLLNVVFPHVLVTLAMRTYAPGTLTALLLNAPVCALLLEAALRERYVDHGVFLWAGPLVVLAILGAIPLLFAVGRWLRSAGRDGTPGRPGL